MTTPQEARTMAESLRALSRHQHSDLSIGAEADDMLTEYAALLERQAQPVAWWIPKADQFCVAGKDRPFAKAWEPLYAAPQPAPQPATWTDADADAARLAMELQCLLTDKDVPMPALSRWWDSAHEALELHRKRMAEPPNATAETRQTAQKDTP